MKFHFQIKFLIIFIFLLPHLFSVYCLTAPYLFGCHVINDSTSSIHWRNNDVGSTGFILYRSSSSVGVFGSVAQAERVVASAGPPIDSILDIGLAASTTYYYKLKAFASTDTSDFSNIDSVTTLPINQIFKKAGLELSWNIDSSRIEITMYDSSNCEVGYRVLFSEDSGPFGLLIDTLSVKSKNTGNVFLKMATLKKFTWYDFKVITYKNSDSLISQRGIYTFDANEIIKKKMQEKKRIYLGEKVSVFPIVRNSWAFKAGDSIFIQEKNSPASTYSFIDVSNVKQPSFKKYKSSINQSLFVGNDIRRYLVKGNTLICNVADEYPLGQEYPSAIAFKVQFYNYSDTDSVLQNEIIDLRKIGKDI